LWIWLKRIRAAGFSNQIEEVLIMKEKRKPSPKMLGSETREVRAKKLADASLPIVADLYLAHLQACEANQEDGTKRKRRVRSVPPDRAATS
jgi:hypothetical protein